MRKTVAGRFVHTPIARRAADRAERGSSFSADAIYLYWLPLGPVADLLAWAATILAAIAAAAGLFVTELYRDVPFWAEQARGIDLLSGLWAGDPRHSTPLY